VNNWLLTLGVLILFALIFAGVNIGMILLSVGALISIAYAVMESIEHRKKKKALKHKEG
jgi:hypothetical protein